jgi:integrase/recombinase XerD
MSIRLRDKRIPDKWYIIVEGKFTSKKGKPVRQKLVPFDGSRSEAMAIDAELNDKPMDMAYPSIFDILPRFLDYYANNSQPKSYISMEGALKHLLPFYGDMRIPLIANHHHEAYKTERLAARYLPGKPAQTPDKDTIEEAAKRKPLAKSSINRELACLKSILAWAKKEKIAVESIPEAFSKRQSAGKEMVPLAPSQLKSLLSLIQGPHVITIMLMIYCGLRLKEATSMRCEDIHLANRTLYVLGKGGGRQPVEIPAPLIDPLKAAIGKKEGGLLSENPKTKKPYGNIMKALNTFCKLVGVTRHVSHHTLRHSCTTALILAGVSLPVVQQKLRHSEIKTTMSYVHVAAHFGTSTEPKIAREIFWLNEDGTQKEAPTGIQRIVDLSKLGALRPDDYPKDPRDIRDIEAARKPSENGA